MARKPADTIQVNLRIKELLRRQLEAAAKSNQVSINREMTTRIQNSFDQESLQDTLAKINRAAQKLLG